MLRSKALGAAKCGRRALQPSTGAEGVTPFVLIRALACVIAGR